MAKMSERHTQILELLTEQKRVEVTELSELLHVSQVTIRKDLDQLENAGLILRAHGFATLNSSDDMNNRLAYHYDVKQKIAKLACESIRDGETIMIESGSCCALSVSYTHLLSVNVWSTGMLLRSLLPARTPGCFMN